MLWKGKEAIFLTGLLSIMLFPMVTMGLSSNLEVCSAKDITNDPFASKIYCGPRDDSVTDEAILCVRANLKCNFVNDCPALNFEAKEISPDELNCVKTTCNFENKDFCGWEISSSAWIIVRDDAYTLADGSKIGDHTYGRNKAGHFLLGDFSKLSEVSHTFISTPIIGETSNECSLEFFYYVLPGTNATLRIKHLAVAPSNNHSLEPLILQTIPLKSVDLEISEDDGILDKKWNYAKAFWLKSTFYKIILSIEISNPNSQGILLDDIKFLNCEIPEGTPSFSIAGFKTHCEPEEFDCKVEGELTCIEINRKCDGEEDCPGGLDENDCTCDQYASNYCHNGICYFNATKKRPSCLCQGNDFGERCNMSHDSASKTDSIFLGILIGTTASVAVFYAVFLACVKRKGSFNWRRFHSSNSTEEPLNDSSIPYFGNVTYRSQSETTETEEFEIDEIESQETENVDPVTLGSQENLIY